MTKFYSIRVIEANDLEEAISKVQDQEFCDEDPMCDSVLTKEQILENLRDCIMRKKRR